MDLFEYAKSAVEEMSNKLKKNSQNAAKGVYQLVPQQDFSKAWTDEELYKKYDVKRGLRDINGKGVVAGLTEISEIRASKIVDGEEIPCEGELYYRGYDSRYGVLDNKENTLFEVGNGKHYMGIKSRIA